MRSKWAAGKAVRARLAVRGRISKSIRNRRATQPSAHFHRDPLGAASCLFFRVARSSRIVANGMLISGTGRPAQRSSRRSPQPNVSTFAKRWPTMAGGRSTLRIDREERSQVRPCVWRRLFLLRAFCFLPYSALPQTTLSSSGLGHRPFTAVTRVRIPLGSLDISTALFQASCID